MRQTGSQQAKPKALVPNEASWFESSTIIRPYQLPELIIARLLPMQQRFLNGLVVLAGFVIHPDPVQKERW